MSTPTTTCTLCDALCRLRITVEDGVVQRVAGVPEDPWSHGHVCPKAVALKDLQEDPDRLRRPLRRTAGGWEEVGWDEALAEVTDRLAAIRRAHGRDAAGVYLGNPNVHHPGNLLGAAALIEALSTRHRFSAQSVDNLPHTFAALHVLGHPLLVGVADVDRADLVVLLGANPWVSNGGGLSSGDVRRRLTGVQARGGRLVVIDPRRTETAEAADAHLPLRPGTDALLLLAVLHVLFDEDRVAAGPWRTWSRGLDALRQAADRFPPERVAAATGLSADAIRDLARALSDAPRAAIHARLGACTQRFGGLTAWLVVALHAVTGNLDRAGGLMFARPAIDVVRLTTLVGERGSYTPGAGPRGLPEVNGELPAATLPDALTSGDLRALVVVAGNPALSLPGVERHLGRLDLLVSLDLYLNETSRHAHLILPVTPPLSRDHYPLGLSTITVRTIASFAPAVLPPDGGRDDFDLLTSLAAALARRERRPRPWALARALRAVGVRRVLDLLLRVGPYRLRLSDLAASPTTVDLGPLAPCLPGRLATPDRLVDLAPAPMLADLPRLEAALDDGSLGGTLLIGRRTLRSNNSWLHNSARLVRGRPRCTLLVRPEDAPDGVRTGDPVRVVSRVGAVEVPCELTDALAPGVVSLPHGWGHDRPGTRLSVASQRPGVSANALTDPELVDELTGTTALFGVPVRLERP